MSYGRHFLLVAKLITLLKTKIVPYVVILDEFLMLLAVEIARMSDLGR